MEPEPIFDREDVNEIKWLLADILNELKEIKGAFDDGEEEEAD